MSKKITIKDIAREAGVSIALVSFVMNDRIEADGSRKYRVSKATRERVLEVARRLNYQPSSAARALRKGHSHAVGVIVPDISNRLFGRLSRLMENIAFCNGYTVLFGSSDEDPVKFAALVQTFLDKDVEGFVVIPVPGSLPTMIHLRNTGIPFVVLDRTSPGFKAPTILFDYKHATLECYNTLSAAGCKRIGMVTADLRVSSILEREQTFTDLLLSKGMRYPEKYIWHMPIYDGEKQAEKIVDRLLSEKIDGVIMPIDLIGAVITKELCRRGVAIQKDIYLAGIGETDLYDLFSPSIPYYAQPLKQTAYEAAFYLGRLIAALSVGEDITEDCRTLVLRGEMK